MTSSSRAGNRTAFTVHSTPAFLSKEEYASIRTAETIVRARKRAGDTTRPECGSTPAQRLEWMATHPAEALTKVIAFDDGPLEPIRAHLQRTGRLYPRAWGMFFFLLVSHRWDEGQQWGPPLPIDLSSWFCVCTLDTKEFLRERLIQQLRWALAYSRFDIAVTYLNSLDEPEWVHEKEL